MSDLTVQDLLKNLDSVHRLMHLAETPAMHIVASEALNKWSGLLSAALQKEEEEQLEKERKEVEEEEKREKEKKEVEERERKEKEKKEKKKEKKRLAECMFLFFFFFKKKHFRAWANIFLKKIRRYYKYITYYHNIINIIKYFAKNLKKDY